MIHPQAIIDDDAQIASGVEVGPWSYIGPGVSIDEGTTIASHVVIKKDTTIGKNNKIFQFATLGEDTPDLKYKGEKTSLIIGDNNIIREGATIHRGTIQDNGVTLIGNNNVIMAYVHIGHDCIIKNQCILVNNVALAGHVIVNDWAILSGYVLVHQYCQIGEHSFCGMRCNIVKDIPAYMMVNDQPARVRGINTEGLKRRGFSKDSIANIKKAYKVLYRQELTFKEAVSKLESMSEDSVEISNIVKSIKVSNRSILR
jgi:UDP-N-acetylglucosamine acyltransferase